MYPGTDIYALGTDETLSFYALQSQKEEEEEPAPKTFGDVREALGCEYLAKMHWVGGEPFVAAGKHRYVWCEKMMYEKLTACSESRLDLIPVRKNASEPLQYEFNAEKSTQLPGAHGEELVRDIFTDIHVSNRLISSSMELTSCTDQNNIYMWRRWAYPGVEGCWR